MSYSRAGTHPALQASNAHPACPISGSGRHMHTAHESKSPKTILGPTPGWLQRTAGLVSMPTAWKSWFLESSPSELPCPQLLPCNSLCSTQGCWRECVLSQRFQATKAGTGTVPVPNSDTQAFLLLPPEAAPSLFRSTKTPSLLSTTGREPTSLENEVRHLEPSGLRMAGTIYARPRRKMVCFLTTSFIHSLIH